MPMPNSNLNLPLLGNEPREGVNAIDDNRANERKESPIKTVRFRDPLEDTNPTVILASSALPKSILKEPGAIRNEPVSTVEASTAGIIRSIQEKYAARNPLVAHKKHLKNQRKVLTKNAGCCESAGCACCVTTTIAGITVAATSAVTASCSPWSALLAIPFAFTICFWKKSSDIESKIRNNILDTKKIDLEISSPPEQRMLS